MISVTDNSKELEIFRSRIETAPEELMKRTLEAMEQREKDNAEKAAAKLERKAIHKNFAFRAAVIAAVITLMILIIPTSRGYVVSAAERVWEFFIKSNGHYSYDLDSIEFNPEISNNNYSYDYVDLGNVNQTIKVGCLEYEFTNLYIKRMDDPDFPKTELIIETTVTHDNTIDYMPDFSNSVSLVGLKHGDVVFSCSFGDGELGYYRNLINGTNIEYYSEKGNRIPPPYREGENDEITYIEDKTKIAWYQNKVAIHYKADFWYFNFDKFGNDKDRNEFEKYKNELFTYYDAYNYNEFVMTKIKTIKPDTYIICHIDSEITTFDSVSHFPECGRFITCYNFSSKDYEKYRKYFNKF